MDAVSPSGPQSISLPDTKPPAPGTAIRVVAGDRPVAIFNQGGKLYAIGAVCTHAGGPLEKGPVKGGAVTCPWHGSQFDLSTGVVLRGPARTPEPAYRVTVTENGLTLEPI